MSEKKALLCPLRVAAYDQTKPSVPATSEAVEHRVVCLKERCAWWRHTKWCAILDLAISVSDSSALLEREARS